MILEPRIASRISRSGVGVVVPSAVGLDHQALRRAGEVDDPRSDLVLSPEAKAEGSVSKHSPQISFGVCLLAAKRAGMLDVLSVAAHFDALVQQVGPSPRPSPRWRRERET